jgi:hypothetical protein
MTAHPTFSELQRQIAECPVTFLPALLITVLETCRDRSVFQPGGVTKIVLRVIPSEFDTRASSSGTASNHGTCEGDGRKVDRTITADITAKPSDAGA